MSDFDDMYDMLPIGRWRDDAYAFKFIAALSILATLSAGEYYEVRALNCPPIYVSLGGDGVPIISREVGIR